MSDSSATITPPKRLALLLECRTALDLARMTGPLLSARLRAEQVSPETSQRSPILVIPGFGSGDRYTHPLRYYLTQLGYHAEGWGLGKNLAGLNLSHQVSDLSDGWEVAERSNYRGEAGVPYLCDRLVERVLKRHQALDQPITLIGWSLGGYLAREVARDLPDIVDNVITMGAPTIGGPKYTAAASLFRQRGMDLDWIESEISKRESRPIQQPITAIYSKSDAIVSWRAAIDHISEQVNHIQVKAAHLGMGFNPTIWAHVRAALEQANSCGE